MKNSPSFQLAVLDESIYFGPPSLGQDLQTSWSLLQKAYPSRVIYSITEDDIDIYNWPEQVIVLTSEASVKLLDTLGTCHEDFEKKIGCLVYRAFVVACEDIPVYGGVFFPDLPVATAVEYPVIYPGLDKERVTFAIRPNRLLFRPFTDTDWQIIKDEKIKAIFAELDKLAK